MNRFEGLVTEFKTMLGRDLFQKELDWIQWVVDRENIKKHSKRFLRGL